MPARPYTTLNVRLPERVVREMRTAAMLPGERLKSVLEQRLMAALDKAEQRSRQGWVACNERLPRLQFSVSHELMERLGRLSETYGIPRSTIAHNLLVLHHVGEALHFGRTNGAAPETRLVA